MHMHVNALVMGDAATFPKSQSEKVKYTSVPKV